MASSAWQLEESPIGMERHYAIIRCLAEKIEEIIRWGCSIYNIPVLIVNTRWSFSGRYTTSSISGSQLKFTAFFSLYDILNTWETGGTFYESFKRVKDDPIIGTFTGSGLDLLIALVCHEMAHIFDSISLQEMWFPTKVLQYYGRVPRKMKTRHHHNELWRIIYRELKTLFMPESPRIEYCDAVDLVSIKSPTSVDFYAKHLTLTSI